MGKQAVRPVEEKFVSRTRKTPKRGFAVLDREKALKAVAGPVGLLRRLSTGATSTGGGRCRNALEGVETELNDILRFSSDSRLPDDLVGDAEAVSVSADSGMVRKSAAGAVKALRRILKNARADLSVPACQSDRLDDALDRLEEELNGLLPPPGASPKPRLPDSLFYEDAEVPVDTASED